MSFTAAELARQLDGTVTGDGSTLITGFAPAGNAKPGDLTFAENEVYFRRAEQSPACAILVDSDLTTEKKVIIRVASARVAYARALPLFFPEPAPVPGIHPSAVVSPSATVDPTAHVGPLCVISDGAHVGARTVLKSHVFLDAGAVVGDDAVIFSHVTLYPKSQVGNRVRIHAGTVIGSDGFGYVLDNGVHRKVPQVGGVILQDDVEVGAGVTIDRGALGPTIIGRGTKIDNLVQIAHNVSVGEHSLIVAQAGIAGSTKLGSYVTLAGQVGIAGHLKIGSRVTVAAQSGVMHDIPEGQKWFGSPAQPDRAMKRQLLAAQHLPEILRRLHDLEKQLSAVDPEVPGQT
jgi:UDP-3-O-[3-hydroxymyristoyl] glucosamine N-acyltransferase